MFQCGAPLSTTQVYTGSPEAQPIVSTGSPSHAVVPLSDPTVEPLDPASTFGTPMVPWQAMVQRGAAPAPSQM